MIGHFKYLSLIDLGDHIRFLLTNIMKERRFMFMKHKLLLVLPMMFLLTACDLSSIFGNNGNSSTSSNKKETLEQMMNKETITHYGSEKTRDEFLSLAPNNQTLSAEARGYNYCTVSYSAAYNQIKDELDKMGNPTYYIKQFREEETYFWEQDKKGNTFEINYTDTSDNYIYGTVESLVKTAEREIAQNIGKFYVASDSYYAVFRYKSNTGKNTWYYRREFKWNKNGDILAADIFAGLDYDGSEQHENWAMTFAYSTKTA